MGDIAVQQNCPNGSAYEGGVAQTGANDQDKPIEDKPIDFANVIGADSRKTGHYTAIGRWFQTANRTFVYDVMRSMIDVREHRSLFGESRLQLSSYITRE